MARDPIALCFFFCFFPFLACRRAEKKTKKKGKERPGAWRHGLGLGLGMEKKSGGMEKLFYLLSFPLAHVNQSLFAKNEVARGPWPWPMPWSKISSTECVSFIIIFLSFCPLGLTEQRNEVRNI